MIVRKGGQRFENGRYICPHCGKPDDGGDMSILFGVRFHRRCFAPWLDGMNGGAQARIAELTNERDMLSGIVEGHDQAIQRWGQMIDADRARIAELEAALALRTGADHDEDCKARRGKLCNCGHTAARRALEAKP